MTVAKQKSSGKVYIDKGTVIAFLLIVIVICCLAFGSLANRNTLGHTTNTVTTGQIKTKIHNLGEDGQSMPEYVYSILPGTNYTNRVYAENTCNEDEWVRIKITPVCTDASGEELSTEDIHFNIGDKWIYNNGYYYYTEIVPAGTITEDLYNTVSFGTSIGNEYATAALSVKLELDAVQSDNNANTVLDAAGWGDT